ncbi:H-NS histone family protein [Phaeobacter sp. QD34_3]|uniref:H-NS histone family protein n=1 Tax=unclassified Phaeobacter TaxID=2621772 RepID=UPI00237FC169|nr:MULTISPECIES: H-NS histone family protein [unclassified Phaeobacter]MDE4132873.1 H-NS histone family protein [Phaeobacter sp. QD34_3]MDE4136334.1 H-NS histone family protein [Phaeobacter sp. QD34_24]MDE4174742.1 H-NS histone family protein [Phaeobacter sp. PT47_59]
MSIDLSSMSRSELVQLKADVETAIKSAEVRERQEALKAAEEAAAKFGFSLEEIAGAARSGAKKQKAAAKYRNPNNPEETWSGRGRKPHWVHAALTAGMDISDLEI